MALLSSLSESLLYVSLSILMGSFLLFNIPDTYKPVLKVPKGVLLSAVTSIPFLTVVPILEVAASLSGENGFGQVLAAVLFTFDIGIAWVFTFFLSSLFFLFIWGVELRRKRFYAVAGVLLTVSLILIVSFTSHAKSIAELEGFLAHTLHFLAMSVWVGILLVAGWASKSSDAKQWQRFLRWFTPVAVICFSLITASGFLLMSFVNDLGEYVNAWTVSYGQALLWKHILLVPLLTFAGINALLLRRRLKNDSGFHPSPWLKAEGLLIYLVFTATAVLSKQEPPHNIEEMIASSGKSPMFEVFYQGNATSIDTISLGFEWSGLLLLLLSCAFLLCTLLSFRRKTSVLFGLTASLLGALTIYLGLMLSLQ